MPGYVPPRPRRIVIKGSLQGTWQGAFLQQREVLVDQGREKSHAVSLYLICVWEVENQVSQLSAEPMPSVPSPLSGNSS